MPSEGPGGIELSDGFVVLGSRDALDERDIFRCFDNQNGNLVWQHTYPASGHLDYGNAPGATPLIYGDCVYTLGALGQLCCIELESGILLWQKNLAEEYQTPPLTWGHSGSPLIVKNRLIVQPGGKKARRLHWIRKLVRNTGSRRVNRHLTHRSCTSRREPRIRLWDLTSDHWVAGTSVIDVDFGN